MMNNVSIGSELKVKNVVITGSLTMDEDAVLNRKFKTLMLWDP